MRAAERTIWLGAAAALAAAGCGQGPVTLPTPPMQAETAQLVATYQMPTGTLDAANVQQALSDAETRLAQLPLDWLPEVLSGSLAGLGRRLSESSLPTSPSEIPDPRRAQLTAVAEVNRACQGFGGASGASPDAGAPVDAGGSPDAAAHGTLDLTAIVDTGKLNPELWGTGSACQEQVSVIDSSRIAGVAQTAGVDTTLDVVIDGTLIIYLLGPIPTDVNDLQALIVFSGTLGVQGQTFTGSFDFEIVNDSVRFRIQEGGGDVIVTVGTTLGIEGANGGFSCDVTSGDCTKTS